jgi:uncharacterized protein
MNPIQRNSSIDDVDEANTESTDGVRNAADANLSTHEALAAKARHEAPHEAPHKAPRLAKAELAQDHYTNQHLTTRMQVKPQLEEQVDFAGACAYALARLEAQLPSQFGYHSLEHTRDNVYPTALHIATLEGVCDHDLLLVKTAAFYHDLGFTEPPYTSLDHEVRGAHIAMEVLPKYGYDEASIHTIQGMIQATKLPQQPHNLLENIMADADLSVLGQRDFLVQNRALRAELESSGLDTDNHRWLQGQYNFLTNHRYYTTSAKRLLCAQKAVNLAALRTLLIKLNQTPASI